MITGCAGFIGAALTKRFLSANYKVIGIDNLNDYYDQDLKRNRLKDINNFLNGENNNWEFQKLSIDNINALNKIFSDKKPNIVINLAAQAGVRYSIKNPASYVSSNLIGFFNISRIAKTSSRTFSICI